MKMKVLVWISITFILVSLGMYLGVASQKRVESFHVEALQQNEEKIIALYSTLLQRQPTSNELVDATRKLQAKQITMAGLKQRIMDSEEYTRLIKLQTADLAPELSKMISDKKLIEHISALYLKERKTRIPAKAVLPLKDVYVHLEYNDFAFRAFLRSKNYAAFQEDALRANKLDKEGLMVLFDKNFKVETLQAQGAAIAKKEARRKTSSTASVVAASTTTATGVATPKDKDSNMTPMVNKIVKDASKVFNKDREAEILDALQANMRVPFQTSHTNGMVLRPDQAWNVPYRPPPVCTTLGQKPLTQPLLTNSKLLLGTPLGDATDTQVGSIMPKFEYKEYVDISKQ
jgi:hypothetical protein